MYTRNETGENSCKMWSVADDHSHISLKAISHDYANTYTITIPSILCLNFEEILKRST